MLTSRKGRLFILFLVVAAAAAMWTTGRAGSDGSAFLGVHLEEETDYEEGGARITDVVEDSPADEAGLEDGDIVVRFDGHTVRGPGALGRRIDDRDPGDSVEIVVVRDGRERTLQVELGEHPHRLAYSFGAGDGQVFGFDLDQLHELHGLGDRIARSFAFECDDGDCRRLAWHGSGRPKLGVQLAGTTPELRKHFGADEDTGVLVSRILPDTPAASAGIEVGDLIVAIEGEPIHDVGDIRSAIADKVGESVDVQLLRNGSARTIEVVFPEPDELELPTGPRAYQREIRRAVEEV